MKKYAYFNGEIIPEDDIVISHRDLGFLRGYGVMDAMKTVGRKSFLIKEHFNRLEDGVEALNLKLPINLQEFNNIIDALLGKSGGDNDVAIKTIVTGGHSSNGLKIDGTPTILITMNDLDIVSPSKDDYKDGIGIVSAEFQRAMPITKTTNYIFALQQQELKVNAGANEVVYKKDGVLLEGATSNIFIINKGMIITPSKGILMGTMRNFVIDLLGGNGIKVEEREVKFEELLQADEAFLTGTFKDILPVVRVDDIIIDSGVVGKVTQDIMEAFRQYKNKN